MTQKSLALLSATCSDYGLVTNPFLSSSMSSKATTVLTRKKPSMTRLRRQHGAFLNHLMGQWQSCSLMRGRIGFSIRIYVRRSLKSSRFRMGLTPRKKVEETLSVAKRLTLYSLKTRLRAYRSSKIFNVLICR